jgi:ATP-dependent Clp protease ATP-binding subunit ClpA
MLIDSAEREAPLNNAVIVYAVTLTDDEHDRVFKNVNRTMGFSNQTKSEGSTFNEAALNKIVGEELIKVADELIVFNPLDSEVLNKIFDENVNEYLEMYDVDVDLKMLREAVLQDSKHGRDIVSKLSSEVPKFVFKKLKQEK